MIDWDQVKSLRNDVGHDEFDEIILLFLEEVEDVLHRLKENPVLSDLESNMHFLKGSALNLGFSKFSKKCREGEIMSARGRAEAVNIPDIIISFYDSKTIFMNDLALKFEGEP